MAAGRIKGITIEIGGDSTKLVSALAKVDNSISKTQSNLRDLNRALKLDPGNTELLKDKQTELGKAIEDTKSKLETEKQALEQMKNTEGFDANSQAARDLKVQIDLDTAALKELETQARQSSSVLGDHYIGLVGFLQVADVLYHGVCRAPIPVGIGRSDAGCKYDEAALLASEVPPLGGDQMLI